MTGFRRLGPFFQSVELGGALRVKPREGFPTYVRGRVIFDDSKGNLLAMPWKSEDVPSSRMNAFLVSPAGIGKVNEGDVVKALLFSPPEQFDSSELTD